MFFLKKIVLVGLATLLIVLVAFVVHRTIAVEKSEATTTDTQSSIDVPTERITSATTTTSVVSTVLQFPDWNKNPDWKLKTAELEMFFETYEQPMLELTVPLMELDIQSISIPSDYPHPYYTIMAGDDIPFEGELKEKFEVFLSTAGAETGYLPSIDIRIIDEKRAISFDFNRIDGGAVVIYMPDGYVRMVYPDPGIQQSMDESETKLADNWYSYWYDWN